MKKLTDEEIEKKQPADMCYCWTEGAKWYRDQVEKEPQQIARQVRWNRDVYDVHLIQIRQNNGFPFYLTPSEFDEWAAEGLPDIEKKTVYDILREQSRQPDLTHEEKVQEGKEKEPLQHLEELLKVQCSDGNRNYDEYMFGMANGMILAESLWKGNEPKYMDRPEGWLKDKEYEAAESELDKMLDAVREANEKKQEPNYDPSKEFTMDDFLKIGRHVYQPYEFKSFSAPKPNSYYLSLASRGKWETVTELIEAAEKLKGWCEG